MQFVHRLRTVWSWLPAFRAVAETQHLPSAAQQLGVVPSSLSRMVKQIEDELGLTLFDRTSKAMVLNEAGRTFLTAIREAMRIVDDALGAAVGDEMRGSVGVIAATAELVRGIVIPAVAMLNRDHPELVVSTAEATGSEALDALLRGDADAAVMFHPVTNPDLDVTELARWSRGVFGNAAAVRSARARCVVVGSTTEPINDDWPAGHDRVISAYVPDERSALELCARGDLVVVATLASVRSSGLADRLVQLPDYEIAPRTLHLLHRRALGRHRRTEALVAALRRASADG